LIIAAIALQFFWFFIKPAGNRLAPRSPEMVQALRAFEANRSTATESAMWEQVRRDDLKDLHRQEILLGILLLADAIVIYFFGIMGSRKRAQKPGCPSQQAQVGLAHLERKNEHEYHLLLFDLRIQSGIFLGSSKKDR